MALTPPALVPRSPRLRGQPCGVSSGLMPNAPKVSATRATVCAGFVPPGLTSPRGPGGKPRPVSNLVGFSRKHGTEKLNPFTARKPGESSSENAGPAEARQVSPSSAADPPAKPSSLSVGFHSGLRGAVVL